MTAALQPGSPESPELRGELLPRRYGRVLTVLLGVSGLLLVLRGLQLIARLAFLWRTPTVVRLSERGLELSQRTLVLGRLAKDRNLFIPLDSLLGLEREVRYANGGFYAGLAALVAGTYLGVSLAVEGFRAGSAWPGLLSWGLLLMVGGVLLDFVCGSVLEGTRGRCRLSISTADGSHIDIGALDPTLVDDLLARLKTAIGPTS